MFAQKLNNLMSIHSNVKKIHTSLSNLYPVAITDPDKNKLIIYDVNSSGKYEYITEEKVGVTLPKKVRASFPVEFYDSKSCCVVSEDIFEENNSFVTFFHEFVHCYQYNYCETAIKESLSIVESYDNLNWELEHSFPYDSKLFKKQYDKIIKSIKMKDKDKLKREFKEIKTKIEKQDYEYMIWQIWKEGFARYIENEIRSKYNLQENKGGKNFPYNRISFYYLGDKLISFLNETNKKMIEDIKSLYDILYNYEY